MATWAPLNNAPRSVRAVQAQTDAAPTLVTEGVSLENLKSLLPVIRAPGGQTFSGTGTMLGYIWTGSQWDRCPRLDHAISDAVGLTDMPLESIVIDHPRGRFALVPSGIGLSGGGGNITTDYLCVNIPTWKTGASA